MKKHPVTLLIFYVLVFYVFLQFSWWAYLIVDLNMELIDTKKEIALHSGEDINPGKFDHLLRNKLMMVTGEGLVFLLLLFIGFNQVRKSFIREFAAAGQQKNFLLSVTHELNSPLASIKLYLQTLLKRNPPKEKREEMLTKAIQDVDRQSKLINNILTATKVDNNSYTFEIGTVNMSDLISTLIEGHPQDTHKVQFHNTCDGSSAARADKTAVESIFTNLFENALKYSPKNSTVHVSVRCIEDQVQLVIEDEGAGIRPEDRDRIFKKFYRSGNEETRKTKGTGLGLYLVRVFAESMNGKVSCENRDEGGALFRLSLPAAKS